MDTPRNRKELSEWIAVIADAAEQIGDKRADLLRIIAAPGTYAANRDLTVACEELLWGYVAACFPHAKSGDLSPEASGRVTVHLEEALAEWCENNVFVDGKLPHFSWEMMAAHYMGD